MRNMHTVCKLQVYHPAPYHITVSYAAEWMVWCSLVTKCALGYTSLGRGPNARSWSAGCAQPDVNEGYYLLDFPVRAGGCDGCVRDCYDIFELGVNGHLLRLYWMSLMVIILEL